MIKAGLIIALSILNFYVWYKIGECFRPGCHEVEGEEEGGDHDGSAAFQQGRSHLESGKMYSLSVVANSILLAYRKGVLVNIRLPEFSTLLVPSSTSTSLSSSGRGNYDIHSGASNQRSQGVSADLSIPTACRSIINPLVSKKQACFAVVTLSDQQPSMPSLYSFPSSEDANKLSMYNLDRFAGNQKAPFFDQVTNQNARSKLNDKVLDLFPAHSEIEAAIKSLLVSKGFHEGDDIVTMVVNAGELDLLLNFLCHCRQYNISIDNVLVMVSSDATLAKAKSMLAAFLSPANTRSSSTSSPPSNSYSHSYIIGAFYHPGMGRAPDAASLEYLDATFQHMMWFKSLSVYLLLRLNYNVLFQDIDIIWFRDPRPYVRDVARSRNIAFVFSDDGQRGLRYAPFYANSGFYYLKAVPVALDLAYRILMAIDMIHVTGSHQNVVNTKLLELIDFSGSFSLHLLDEHLFVSGHKFHHDRPFMIGLKSGHERPLLLHMCWTSNKNDKIHYLTELGLWALDQGGSCGA